VVSVVPEPEAEAQHRAPGTGHRLDGRSLGDRLGESEVIERGRTQMWTGSDDWTHGDEEQWEAGRSGYFCVVSMHAWNVTDRDAHLYVLSDSVDMGENEHARHRQCNTEEGAIAAG